ncbi:C6 zinc finger domain-containing protein [Plectosphaerella plurivora]|uniref:C6 zinc finger domain-containing protein n=1 Tax=Plectosphaerella plurivora TaxID=936078 RepID=A0A9P8V9K8_9PEZI|nr:C6 zinc finger domain-containing protein [Plectosphaerella plurivora]
MTDGDTSSPPREQTPPKVKRTRTRTGCLNCRRKKRKCDEARPACGGCSRRGEPCRWGIKVTFRADNAQTIPGDHPSMRPRRRRPRQFEIMDVTDEVIRDYHLPPSCSLGDHERESEDDDSYDIEVLSPQETSTTVPPALPTPTSYQDGDGHGLSFITAGRKHSPSPSSQVVTDNAVANLLYFSQGGPGDTTNADAPPLLPPLDALPMEPLVGANNPFHPFDFGDHLFTPEGSLEDGIFLPGSAFQELHSTLRNHLIQEVKSNGPTRPCSPAVTINPEDEPGTCTGASTLPPVCPSPDPAVRTPRELSTDHEPPELSGEEECLLWNNWFEEISPWLDKFDTERHFQHVLPGMARSHDHLRYSMLALSARQRELKSASRATDLSLSLYQEAIHLLLPQLSIRSTPVIASCIVLCVLEMCSCSPKAWRRHLDGCASLMEAVGMTGFDGGLEQALFWCFARMDVCGGLISSVKTLIPTGHWASRVDMAADAALFRRSAPGSFAMWANYAVYLCAQVLDLLAPLAQANPGGLFFEGPRHDADYRAEWLALWRLVDEWHASRPAEMCHVFALASTPTNPFPAVVYSNSAAISGNQMYHTAALLMLQNKPASLRLGQKSKSALWHARQICAISLSNHHHGAWTNSIQPLWIAGRCMSHPAEHKAILELYAKIERESGWSTKWRADDLQDFWGDLAEDDE